MKISIGHFWSRLDAVFLRALHCGGAALITSVAPSALAGPEGGQVVRGSADIASAAGVTTINQQSERAVLVWDAFNVGASEQVTFNQPSVDAAALNRVTGAGASIIEGLLTANGNVFIVNPAGILFSDTARVDVGGLVATTANIGDDAFMAGNLEFDLAAPTDSAVVNRGLISARDSGLVALVAPGIANSGVIEARLGTVTLASGRTFTLDLYGDGLVKVPIDDALLDAIVTADGQTLRAQVDQAGELSADGGRVYLLASAAGAAFDAAINARGVIRSQTVGAAPGAIVLAAGHGIVDVGGSLDASGLDIGETGGEVTITGEEVALAAGAAVDARGAAGGGTVLIGGDYQGQGELATATSTVVQAGAVIDASATVGGDGGRVIVWADADTTFAGAIRTDGGAARGNGGFIEVSGKEFLRFVGEAFASAPAGVPGAILLDPENIVVTPFGRPYVPPGDTSAAVTGESISQMLRSGMTVTLTADDTVAIRDVIDGRALAEGDGSLPDGQLVLTAARILVDEGFGAVTHNGTIELNAGAGGVSMQADAYLIVASGGLAGDVEVAPGTANITVGGQGAGPMMLARVVSLGTVTVHSQSTVTLSESLFGADGVGVGALSVEAGGAVELNGVGADDSINIRAGGDITVVAASGDEPNTTLIARNNVTLDAVGAITVGAQTGDNASIVAGALDGVNPVTLSLVADGAIALNGGVINERGAVAVGDLARTDSINAAAAAIQAIAADDLSGVGNDIVLRASGAIDVREIVTGRSGNVVIEAGAGVTVARTIGGVNDDNGDGQGVAALDIDAGGTVTLHGSRTIGTTTIRSNGSGDLVVAASTGASGAIVSGGDIGLDAAGVLRLESNTGIDGEGDVTILAGGQATFASSVAAAGTLNVGLEEDVVGAVAADGSSLIAEGGDLFVYANGNVEADLLHAGGNVHVEAGAITRNTDEAGVSISTDAGSVTLIVDGDVSSQGSIIASSAAIANVSISAGGAITLDGPVQTQNGAIGLSATDDIGVADLLTRGAIVITSTGGDVDLARPLNGFVSGAGFNSPASIAVTAEGRVRMTGATTDSGPISITARGQLLDPSQLPSLEVLGTVVSSGDLTLIAGPRGLRLAAGSGLQAGESVAIWTPGAVDLGADVIALNGAITFGLDLQPIASLTMATNTQLQAIASDIVIDATGDVVVWDLVSGGNIEITVHEDGSGINDLVWLQRPLFGFSTTDPLDLPRGVGSLSISVADGAVEMWGVNSLAGPGSVGVAIDAPVVSVMGPITTAGSSIAIGRAAGNVSLNHHIDSAADDSVGGGAIDLVGDVTLFAGRINVERDGFAGIYFDLPTSGVDANALSLFDPVDGFLALDPARAAAPEPRTPGLPVFVEDGSTLFASAIESADASGHSCINSFFYCAAELLGPLDREFLDLVDLQTSDPDADLQSLDQFSSRLDVALRYVQDSIGTYDGERLAQGVNGYRGDPPLLRPFSAWPCVSGTSPCVPDGDLALQNPVSLEEIAEATNRQVWYQRAFGTTRLVIDSNGGAITVHGDIDRFDTLDAPNSLVRSYDSNAPVNRASAVVVAPTYVNHELSIHSGSGLIWVQGSIGDSESSRPDGLGGDGVLGYSVRHPSTWCSGAPCIPVLGEFSVGIETDTEPPQIDGDVHVNTWASSVQPIQSPGAEPPADRHLRRQLNFGGTQFDADRVGDARDPVFGAGGFIVRGPFVGLGAESLDSAPADFSARVGGADSQGGVGGNGSLVTGSPSGTPVSNVDETSRAESEGENVADRTGTTEEDSPQRACPDGAPEYADVGLTKAHTGPPDEVFDRCAGDFGG